MVNLFSFGCHVIDRAYASTDCTGGVRKTMKGRERCLRRVMANPHFLYWTFTIWSIDSCQNKIVTDQYHMTISHLMSQLDLFGSCPFTSLIDLLDRDQCSISYFLASLGAQLIMQTYWTSMLLSIDSFQNRLSVDQYHLSLSRAQVLTHRNQVFLKVIVDKLLVFK